MSVQERTLAIIKPDAVGNKVAGEIISIVEKSGLEIKAMKMVHLNSLTAGEFYDVHRGKPFYDSLLTFMSSGPSVAMVLQGENAISRWRELMGATDPQKAEPNTIRNKYGSVVQKNACHGSDSPENALKEVSFFFPSVELL
ncbi:Nucleoside diphosphate kinase [Chitinispirillum alkaliphilum]|nr:Nucleoside diphosphate kinase [Chitinispirillum alkaliphilum]